MDYRYQERYLLDRYRSAVCLGLNWVGIGHRSSRWCGGDGQSMLWDCLLVGKMDMVGSGHE
jgi:hypothetical protein